MFLWNIYDWLFHFIWFIWNIYMHISSKNISNRFSISNKSWHHLSINIHIRTLQWSKIVVVCDRETLRKFIWLTISFHFILNLSIIWWSKTIHLIYRFIYLIKCVIKKSSYILGWKKKPFLLRLENGRNKHSDVWYRIFSRWKNSPIHL